MKTWIVSSLGEEIIQGWKLFKGGNYIRKYGNKKVVNILIQKMRLINLSYE